MRFGKILKRLVIVLLALFVIAIFVRIFMLNDKSVLSEINATEAAREAYVVRGKNAFLTHKINKEISSDGYFSASSLIYNEEKEELQLTGRFNDSLYSYLNEPEGTEVSWRIVNKTDESSWHGTVAAKQEKYLYNYEKIIFNDIKIEDDSELYLYLCCGDTYPGEKTEGLCIHYPGQELKTYKLSGNERDMLPGD